MECHDQRQQRAIKRQHRKRTHRPQHLPRLPPSRLRCRQDEAFLRLHRIAPVERQLPHEGMVGIRAAARHHRLPGIRQRQQHDHSRHPGQSPRLRPCRRQQYDARDDRRAPLLAPHRIRRMAAHRAFERGRVGLDGGECDVWVGHMLRGFVKFVFYPSSLQVGRSRRKRNGAASQKRGRYFQCLPNEGIRRRIITNEAL